jgi:hypothetical protein
MAVLVVLALVSIALAMSYALLRSQTTSVQLTANNSRSSQARQAALTGLSAGLRAMRLSSWNGVGSTLAGSINATDSYSVTFTAGDSSLAPEAADYSLLPYRVTLLSTGTSIDPAQPTVNSVYKIQAVAELVPREVSSQPSSWSTMLSYAVYQWNSSGVYMAVPCHIEGPVRLQGGIMVANIHHWGTTTRNRYYSDLNLMRSGANEIQTVSRSGGINGTYSLSFNGATTNNLSFASSALAVRNALDNLSTIGAGNTTVTGGVNAWTITFVNQLGTTDVPQITVNSNVNGGTMSSNTSTQGVPGTPDYRQFSGPINTPMSQSSSESQGLLTSQLAITVNNISVSSTTVPTLGSVSTYRLYPGGPTYTAGSLASSVSNATLTPDPVTNPLGLFYNSSNATLGNNVTINGTVVCGADLTINGTNVNILPFELPALENTTLPLRLPTVVTLDDFRVNSGAQATVEGVVCVAGDFDIPQGAESTSLSMTGNVIVGDEITFERRTEWKNYGGGTWDTYYSQFQTQLGQPGANPFFPMWLATAQGRSYVPQLTITYNNPTATRLWQNFSNPVYAVKSGDSGLHWDLVRWKENP